MRVIYITPSNHGVGANRCCHKGCYEDKHTRPIAESVKKYLPTKYFKVVIAAEGTSMEQRVAESDFLRADLHVPVHTNASSDKLVRYLMFMFYADNPKYREMFDVIAAPLERVYEKKAVFDVRRDLYEVTQPKAPTFYCELGFHTSPRDCDHFIHNPDLIGKALAEGICNYFGVEMGEPKKEVVEEDGLWGQSTTRHTQRVLGCSTVDGIVSNQLNSCKKYLPNMLAASWEFMNIPHGGSATIKALQKLVGAEQDGYMGMETVKALQKFLQKLGLYEGAIDGIAGELTVIAWQKYINMKY